MTVISATEIEIRAERLSLPKSAMPQSVFATEGDIIAITIAPIKLQMPARRRADLGRNARVETQPAMALGASVQPFTRAKVKTSVGKKIFILKYNTSVSYCL